MMGLNPIEPGLRRIHYDARSTAKVELRVPAGDTLTVSDAVADQLLAQSTQFKDLDAVRPPAGDPPPEAAADQTAGEPAPGDDARVETTKPARARKQKG